jgi:hypothetical protein
MARRKKTKDDENYSCKIMSHRAGPLVVETTVTTRTAKIDFQDILDACEIDEEDDMGPPWEEHDGWEHDLIRNVDERSPWSENWDEVKKSEAVFYNDRAWNMIVVPRTTLEEWQGKWVPGRETRQQYEDRLTRIRREAVEQLKTWYTDGYHWYWVHVTFMGHDESLGGIQTKDDSPDDPYLDEVKEELAGEIASALEEDGYEVINRPARSTEDTEVHNRRVTREHKIRAIAHHLGFKDWDTYRAWVTDSNEHRRAAAEKAAKAEAELDARVNELLEYLP